jgi:MoaA/NifB/PqqE/SkfB family radical SAM enzyme
MRLISLTRRARRARKRLREARMLVRALRFPYQPVVAHIIPIRRCNLACTYCNEFDDHSSPVPTAEMRRRIDRLAALGTGIITLSGGEPLLHPDLDDLIRHIRQVGSIATVITNGYLLSRDRIKRLNRAGLDHLQISIDNVIPDDVSKKSLKLLDQKLQWLATDAEFDVTVNSVVGGGIQNPDDAVVIAARARDLGLSTTVGIIHDGHGTLLPFADAQRTILEQLVASGQSAYDYANYNRFQKNLANGRPNDWHCRAGSRYLYICEDGLVHWCSQQRGYPGIPLDTYGPSDLEREYSTSKSCAPFCTVGCVHRVAQVDDLRLNPQATLERWFSSPVDGQKVHMPRAVQVLMWAFVTGPQRERFRRIALSATRRHDR